ncbi:MAG: hypothetical protein LW696_07745 [Alphaproteobacteria bacterium]|jgi:hypothetical protein|nr:hypothetical protein [Alphaproteobacteria bacterium]
MAGKFIAKIKWEYGLKEERAFQSKEEREEFLKRNDDGIDTATIYTDLNGIKFMNSLPSGKYCPTRTMSDYEMDVLL